MRPALPMAISYISSSFLPFLPTHPFFLSLINIAVHSPLCFPLSGRISLYANNMMMLTNININLIPYGTDFSACWISRNIIQRRKNIMLPAWNANDDLNKMIGLVSTSSLREYYARSCHNGLCESTRLEM